MGLLDIDSATTTNQDDTLTEYTAGQEPWNLTLDSFEIDSKSTDVNSYLCDFSKWHGMYRDIPELRSHIDVPCRWIIGKKIKFKNLKQEEIANRIKGNGKETIRKIFYNSKRVSKIAGDSFAEIIKDKAGRPINIKALDPGTIEINYNKEGIIVSYSQVAVKDFQGKEKKQRTILQKWEPNEIFHIQNEKVGDEVHGIPEPEKLLKIVKMRHMAMSDNMVVLHRYGKPTFFYEVDTQDTTEIDTITDKIDSAVKDFKNVVVPFGTLRDVKKTSTPQFSAMDPMPWMKFLRSYFTESSNTPDLVLGKSDEVSLAAGKLNYLGFKEKIIMEQLEFAEDIKSQLGWDVEFEEPVEIDLEIARSPQDQSDKSSAKENKKVTTGSPDGSTRGSDKMAPGASA